MLRLAIVLLMPLLPALMAQESLPRGVDPAAIDRSTKPCEDFYQHACGAWIKNNPIPGDQSSWGRFHELQERNRETLRSILEAAKSGDQKRSDIERQIGDFYTSCMDEPAINARGLEPVRGLLDQIAKLPTKFAMTDALIVLHRRQIHPFFRLGAEQDAKDATKMIAGLDQGGLSLPDPDYYLNPDAKSEELRKKFAAHVQKMFELAGDAPEVSAQKSATVMRMETELARRSLDRVSRRDPNKIYHKYTVPELISLSPGIDWRKFFTGMGLPGLESLNVYYPPFVRQIESVTVQNTLDDLKTYVSWHVMTSSAEMLSHPLVEEDWSFFAKTLRGAEQMRPRWKRCVDHTDNLLGDALGQKYVDQTFGVEGKERTLEMVRAIEGGMERDIQSLDWMTPATKKQALAKLHSVANKIGFPDRWDDYSSVTIARDEALENVFRLREWHVADDLAKIGKPVDRGEWGMSPPTVNAYYNPQMNDINFPAGILQPPFYSNVFDDAVNYGAIGAVIGHELTHGFDDEGRQFDDRGNLRDWWTEEDARAFEKRAACIAEQYSEYVAVDDVKLNGKLTLGENVADNGGVRLAFMALMSSLKNSERERIDGFTPEQRFFLGYGQIWCMSLRPEYARMLATVDPHSPGKYRVNGVVSNNPDFAKAFSCRPNQPMVRRNACRVW
jgi:endothelin-converting enzyme/putative endopeptidase